jgi:uncharacterized protein YbjT (DUF2867 family)
LLKAGWQVRVAARHQAVLKARGWRAAEVVAADALDPESLTTALRDIDVAFYLVHSVAAGRQFAALDIDAARNFRNAAASAGIGRIVYLGGMAPNHTGSPYLKSKAAVGDVLRRGRVPVTEIRTSMIVGPGSAAYEIIRDLVSYLPLMITPRWVQSRSSPIALDNLLDYLVGIARLQESAGEIYEAGGPETLTYEQLMRQYAELTDHEFWQLRMPVAAPRLSSIWMKLVTAVPTSIARILIDGLERDAIADTTRIQALMPLELMHFKHAVAAAREAERSNAVSAHWAEGSIVCRNFHPEYAYYAKRAGSEVTSNASAKALWRQVTAFGGDEGYYYAESLWYLRRLINWFAGGPSFSRRRRHPTAVRVGDVIDAWRVIAAEPEKRLTLLMEMRGPGSGVLEFVIRDKKDYRTLSATAYWHPAGPAGLAYWYSLLPVHAFLFRGLTNAVAKRAEATQSSRVPRRAQ